jgi:hypothetical protein
MEKGLRFKAERNKAIAEILKKNEKTAYIADYDGNYFFARIMKVATDFVRFQSFAPRDRAGQVDELLYVNISKISEYKPKGARR